MRFNIMSVSIAAVAAALLLGPIAHAGELEDEKLITNEQMRLSAELPATLVVRTNAESGLTQVLNSRDALPVDEHLAGRLATRPGFVDIRLDETKQAGELDQDSSQSSWYFCFPGSWYYPTYYYYGYAYAYSPYGSYYYGGYYYYFYRWSYRWW